MPPPTRPPRFVDIGINLTDAMFRGMYHGKQAHADDFVHVMTRAKRAGVERMIITAGTVSEAHEALTLALTDNGLFSTVGCHPTRCREFDNDPQGPEAYLEKLKAVIALPEAKNKIVAIGECGLDYDRLHFCPKDVQLKYFEKQIELAESSGLPMFLHNRNTGEDFKEIITRHRTRFSTGVVHSFTGTMEEMKELLDLNLYIGINGCSLKTEENLLVAAAVPLDRLMLETDGPWCDIRPTHASFKHLTAKMSKVEEGWYAPASRKKERFEMGAMVKGRNEPCTMGQVLMVLANLKGLEPEALAAFVWTNTWKVFFESREGAEVPRAPVQTAA